MPMNSEAPRRERIRSGESWSRPSPESTMKRRGWNVVSAPIALVAIGRAQLTGTPSFTSAAARFRFSGVMRLIVPSSSSFPQRPQLLRLEIILTTSLSVRVVVTGVLLGGPQAGSGRVDSEGGFAPPSEASPQDRVAPAEPALGPRLIRYAARSIRRLPPPAPSGA